MGACMFTEASRLLRARAWEGISGNWRGNQGGAAAWGAAMRLLSELKRAAEHEKGEEARAATAASTGVFAGSSSLPSAAAPVANAPPLPPTVFGGSSLQFRLAFEDALAETILADSSDRMETVMRCRPRSLSPVAVVRMVRRAAEAAGAAAIPGVRTPTAGGGNQKTAGPSRAGVGGLSEAERRALVFSSGSTQTLKRCLVILLEDDAKKEGRP